jgi:sugar phosphate isomerase/epimerase
MPRYDAPEPRHPRRQEPPMPAPIALQLYTLRDQAKDGKHVEIIKKVGEMGYVGVEAAGLYGLKPADFRKLVADQGMVVCTNHGPFPNKENMQEQIDVIKGLGCTYAVSGFWKDDFVSVDAIKKAAERCQVAIDGMAKAGLTFVLHNHQFEFTKVDGRLAYEILVEMCPKTTMEIDTYWSSNFGANVPAEMVAKFKQRAPLLHIKDGPMTQGAPMVAAGKGKMDFPAVFKAADPKVLKWAIVELDICATDMVQAVAESYTYLVGKKLATGRK